MYQVCYCYNGAYKVATKYGCKKNNQNNLVWYDEVVQVYILPICFGLSSLFLSLYLDVKFFNSIFCSALNKKEVQSVVIL